ncbi:hypothetical protein WSTR_00950 [Wolbachia endosymbiont of Laodelphax striatellus]|uniref:hypothetical protein n=1 Tax=Wolbachia endosymbiont of Laodelphax striatellus TaxID=368602 RepID=UPI0007C4518D|nr:hypothetical protein [Wolbachia endosymbiont of Laodelphax striatellus]OAB82383.1 hypothetical protein WSTR_00950 [Wolbachia endosymbiont of Laodelphax striatellus]
MFENLTRFKDVKFNAPEESDDQSTQYGVNPNYDCHRKCEANHSHWIPRGMCKGGCDRLYGAPEHTPQESASTIISNTLQNIGDSFHILADSVSVL